MALPILLGIAALSGTIFGAKRGVDGRKKHAEANGKVDLARQRYAKRRETFDAQEAKTTAALESLGRYELELGRRFDGFATLADTLLEQLNAKRQDKLAIGIPRHQLQKVEEYRYTAVGVLGAAAGAGAAGIATSFVVAGGVLTFGVASTGTAIAGLSGAAASNAALAALGGGSLASGGMGIAGGTMIFGATMAAPVVAVLGYAYDKHGRAALTNATKTESEVTQIIAKLDRAERHLVRIEEYVGKVDRVLRSTYAEFDRYFDHLKALSDYLDTAKRDGVDPGPELDRMSDNALRIINNGYALAAILVDMITTPLFRLKRRNGTIVLDANGAPVVETDADGAMVLEVEDLERQIAATRDRRHGIDPA